MRLPRKAALVALLNQKAPAVFLQRFPHFTERQHAPPSTGMAPSEAFLRLKELRKRTGAAVPGEERQNAADAAASVYGDEDSLPSCEELEREFGLFNRGDGDGFIGGGGGGECGGGGGGGGDASTSCSPQVDSQGRVSCTCDGCTRWKAYVAGQLPPPYPSWPQYEVLTKEHVTSVAAYLRARAAHYNRNPLRVLEVGAGDGRLAYHLRAAFRAMDERGTMAATTTVAEMRAAPSVEIFATDNNARGLANPGATPHASTVVVDDALDAIVASSPELPRCDVVLACWQPMGVDWTAAMRAAPHVLEYVLVGETNDGICGQPWATWGYDGDWGESDDDTDGADEEEEESGGMGTGASTRTGTGKKGKEAPPYARDGFERVDLLDVSAAGGCPS
jgi:hypothetical protein